MHTMLYDSRTEKINGIASLSVRNSEDIWFVNSKDTVNGGVLNRADADAVLPNTGDIEITVKADQPANAVTVTDDFVFFTTANQVFSYNWNNSKDLHLKNIGFKQASGIAYGNEKLFVVDHENGQVYKIDGSDTDEDYAHGWIQIDGAYSIYAVNAAWFLAVAFMLISVI